MKLMVLGRPNVPYAAGYRGTYREHPFHFDELPEDHEANRAFRVYVSVTDEGGPIAEMEDACMILRTYRRWAPSRDFELVDVDPTAEGTADTFLGYDISCGFYYSLVAAALEWAPSEESRARCSPGVDVLSELLRRHFHARLNAHRLFDDRQTAQECLDAMMALQRIQPQLYEDSEMEFEVVRLCRVDV